MNSIRTFLDSVLTWTLVALMGFSVINVLWQVFTRWALDDPSSWTEELARYLLIWIGLLGSAFAVSKKLHLAIDLVPSKLTGKRRRVLEIFIELVVFLFAFAVMVVGGLRLVDLTFQFEQTSAALGIPLGYVYIVLPLSGALIMLYAAFSMTDHIRAFRGTSTHPTDPTD